jgi:hypothetical protein
MLLAARMLSAADLGTGAELDGDIPAAREPNGRSVLRDVLRRAASCRDGYPSWHV